MAFNPDEYLSGDFNPDTYLSEDFNPDMYLSGEQPKTTVWQDMDIGLRGLGHSAKTALDMSAGGLAGLAGYTDERDKIFDEMVARQGEYDKEVQGLNQGFGGKVISGLTGIAPVLPLGLVLGPLAAGGTMAGIGALSNAKGNVESGASNAAAITQAMLEGGLDTAALAFPAGKGFKQGAMLGAAGNVAADVGKDITGNILTPNNTAYDPSLEKYAISAAVGALPGGAFGMLDAPSTNKAPLPKKEAVPYNISDKTEAANAIKQVEAEQANIKAQLEDWSQNASINQEMADVISSLENTYNKLEQQRNELDGIINDRSADDVMAKAIKIKEEQDAIKAQRGRRDPSALPQEDASIANADIVSASKPEVAKPTPYETVQKAQEDSTLGTTPFEVALTKVGEAKNMGQVELMETIVAAQEKMDALPPEKDVQRENMLHEIAALTDVLQGKEPDLSWFKGEQDTPVTEEITIDAPKPVFESISDIYAQQGETLQHLADHRDRFFNRQGESNIFFDKTFQDSVFGKMSQKVLGHFLDVTGMGKDEVYISFDNGIDKNLGRLNHIGDTSHIRISPANLAKAAAPIPGTNFGFLKGKALENARTAYTAVRIGAHEIGHIVLNKYARSFVHTTEAFNKIVSEFNDYKAANKLENISMADFWRGEKSAELYTKNMEHFHEYFAERVAKQLLTKEAIGAFSKGRGKVFQDLIDASVNYLKGQGVNVDKKAFSDDIVNNIIESNKNAIRNYSETLWERVDTQRNDMVLAGTHEPGIFQGMTLEDMTKTTGIRSILPHHNPFMGLDLNDIPTVSRRMLSVLGNAARNVNLEFFNRNNVADFNPDSPQVASSLKTMRKHDILAESMVNELWYGKIANKDMKWSDVFTKVKNAASPYIAVLKTSHLDKHAILEVFQKGFDEKLPYAENLTKNGQHLTEVQRNAYNTFAKMFKDKYDQSVKLQAKLGKSNELPFREGWFPSVRQGKYQVMVTYGDLVARMQSFDTKLQAEKHRASLLKSGLKNFDISDVIDRGDVQPAIGNMEIAENVVKVFSQMYPTAAKQLNERGQKLLESYALKGGKLGKHHEYRADIVGYKGSELGLTPEERGRSFGEAIEQFAAEAGMQYKTMLYRSSFDAVLENPSFQKSNPNAHAAIQTMYDSGLGRHTDYLQKFGGQASYQMDRVANSIMETWGTGKKTDKSIANITMDTIRNGFHLMFLMPKVTFAIVGQILSVPPMTIAKMSYDGHGIKAYQSFATGTLKLLSGNSDLWDTLKTVAKHTNTFEPQFMEALTLHKSNHAIVEFIKDYVLLAKPGKYSESASRVLSFSVFYEHYTSLGMSKKEAMQQAIIKTGDSLNLYDKANSAPIFSHLGFLGDAIKPLQGFGQNQLGNIIGMYKYGKLGHPDTWMPLVNFTLMSIAMGGVLGMPFIQEYEKFRRWCNTTFGKSDLPSILDLVASNEGMMNRILPMSQEANNALMLGLPSLTGFDLSSSIRSNQSFPTLLLGVMSGNDAPMDAMPLLQWAAKVPGAAINMGKGLMEDAKSSDIKDALNVIAPAGHVGYAMKEAIGINEPLVFGENTGLKAQGKANEGGDPRTKADIIAGALGTKTSQGRMDELRDFQMQEDEKVRTAKVGDAAVKYVESGNDKFLQRLIDLGATEKEIQNKVNLEVFKRVLPFHQRMMFNKNGKLIAGRGTRAAIGFSKFQKEDDAETD